MKTFVVRVTADIQVSRDLTVTARSAKEANHLALVRATQEGIPSPVVPDEGAQVAWYLPDPDSTRDLSLADREDPGILGT